METLTAKKREIRNRESRILDIARRMVVQHGYSGLNMDRIAEEVGASKGTVYNHFGCKEEIILALAIENVSIRTKLFQKASQYKGCPRFRIHAIAEAAEIFAAQYPDFFLFEQILQINSVREKTSEKRQAVIANCEIQCMTLIAGVARDAIAIGDLKLDKTISPEGLVFGMWALTSGAYSIAATSQTLGQLGVGEPYEVVRCHLLHLLDGHGWKPLSNSFDQKKLLKDIRKTVFTET